MGSDERRAARPSGTAMETAKTATAKRKAIDKNQDGQTEDISLDDDDEWDDIGRCEGSSLSLSILMKPFS